MHNRHSAPLQFGNEQLMSMHAMEWPRHMSHDRRHAWPETTLVCVECCYGIPWCSLRQLLKKKTSSDALRLKECHNCTWHTFHPCSAVQCSIKHHICPMSILMKFLHLFFHSSSQQMVSQRWHFGIELPESWALPDNGQVFNTRTRNTQDQNSKFFFFFFYLIWETWIPFISEFSSSVSEWMPLSSKRFSWNLLV